MGDSVFCLAVSELSSHKVALPGKQCVNVSDAGFGLTHAKIRLAVHPFHTFEAPELGALCGVNQQVELAVASARGPKHNW